MGYRIDRWLLVLSVFGLTMVGCAEILQSKAEPLADAQEVDRRLALWQTHTEPKLSAPATQPTTIQPGDVAFLLDPPYRLNTETIVHLLYHKSPLIIAGRESMIAAQYGLEEFRANLSRLEPFARATTDLTSFPERRDSRGVQGEIVGGLQKETFEGAILRLEGGLSALRVRFNEVEVDQAGVEQGSGAVIRARFEIPFVGSRKRQNRIISQAFQESTAREAMLDYLSGFRRYATLSFRYHRSALLYFKYTQAYGFKMSEIDEMLMRTDLSEADRLRLTSSRGDAQVLHEQYQTSHWTSLLTLLQYLGIQPGEEYVLEQVNELPGRYLEAIQTEEGMQQLLAEAYANTPGFLVLRDAISNAELQRAQAILGTYDVTAFVEGTQFPFGAVAYDSRLEGWQVIAGVTVRLNDSRVLTATRNKAEAEIRQFRAQIEAEQLEIQKGISNRSERLVSYSNSRPKILETLEKAKAEYAERRRAHFAEEDSEVNIDDVLTSLGLIVNAKVRLASNMSYLLDAETDLLTATGAIYRMVGIRIIDDGEGTRLHEVGRQASRGTKK